MPWLMPKNSRLRLAIRFYRKKLEGHNPHTRNARRCAAMKWRIENLTTKKLVGKRSIMSLEVNKTRELWRSFMPRKKEIRNSISTDLYSLQVYGPSYFDDFSQKNCFEKWATMEVTDFVNLPEGMEPLTLTGGLYAVFLFKGAASNGPSAFQYIFETWLPNSQFVLDDRPHFEVLGDRYKNEDPNSEEEIWIPIKNKVN